MDEYGYEPCENCALVSDLEETGFIVDESRIEAETDDGGSGLVVYAFHIPLCQAHLRHLPTDN
ncbi:Uncharacterised protein [Mycobacteroides abscessus subsp. abscessus]|nr:Uncharacterised protein [Mycobacteroides abscessus subsp. abscessus]